MGAPFDWRTLTLIGSLYSVKLITRDHSYYIGLYAWQVANML